ncbi:NAD(P)-dependent oxidoreductase [Hyphomicrobium sp. 99]|uniref:NAD-dependent epimerase/dehydratase family protein n=1 Tax=Hyphomicrobium sp. 99 TaxID=1163419 RepID=UPI0005F77F74|nr:NAD(P)-dependent oxidoreductase [Hyphomicrobium sp. 99]
MIRKVVVTGGSGRVGRYVVRELAKSYDVINADLVADDSGVQHETVDVMDLDALRRVCKGADALVHLAAIDFDWKAAPEKYIRVNTLGTWHALQAASENNLSKVVLCSSISACGLSEMRPEWRPHYLQVNERHENRPVQAYSVSKLLMEKMALSFAQGTSMSVLSLRPLAVVLQETFAQYVEFVEAPDRNWLFYYVTAEDVARAFAAALVSNVRQGEFFLSAADTSRPEPTLEWYADRFGALPEIPNPRIFEQNPRASIFSSAKARDYLGWEPSSNYLEMRKTLTKEQTV